MKRTVMALMCAGVAGWAADALAYGESVGGFPNWEERTFHQLMNRARGAPATDLAGCPPGNCSPAELNPGCYTPIHPLTHNNQLIEAARFHATFMALGGAFAHDSNCVLRTDIAAAYPDTCNGAPACACSGSGTTLWTTRISRFGGTAQGENIAGGQATPSSVHYYLLWEPGNGGGCAFPPPGSGATNGHRYGILKHAGPGVGNGFFFNASSTYDSYWTTDFGSNGVTPGSVRLVSGSHWSTSDNTRQGANIEFSANWYDSAAPTQANVIINGTSFPLSLQRGTVTNGTWSTTLSGYSTGCHRYYFSFRTSGGTLVEYPTIGSYGIGNPSTCADYLSSRPGAIVAGKDDFNRDGMDDIIWRRTTGENSFWYLSGAGVAGGGSTNSVADANWKVAGTGDFNGDTHTDILWHHDLNGMNAVWLMNGAVYSSQTGLATASVEWRPSGAGDFDGNGSTDVVWRNALTGENSIWFLSGTTMTGGGPITSVPDLNWRLVGAGDVNGDGRADLMWWHQTSGSLVVWFMNGLSSSSVFIGQVSDTFWRASALADANGDGRADVIWHHSTAGSVSVWFLNGATVTGGGFVGGVADTQWSVVGSR